MLAWAEYTKLFLALIVIVNPLGAVPLFVSMTEQHTRDEKQTPEEAREAEDKESIAVVPIAIPLLSGPGAMSTTIIFAAERSSPAHIVMIVVCCVLVSLLTYIALRAAATVSRLLGRTGVNIASRIMGLLLAAVAVEILASGIRTLLPGLG